MKIEGTFYFKLTESGNLLGEFTNSGMDNRWNIESANYYSEGLKGNFDCTYLTTWLEDEESFISKLIIKKDVDKEGFYKLDWVSKDNRIFYGNGFVIDNVLSGDYRSCE